MKKDSLSLDEMVQIANKVKKWYPGSLNSYSGYIDTVKMILSCEYFRHREGMDTTYYIEAQSANLHLNGLSLGSAWDDNEENNKLEGLYKQVKTGYEELKEEMTQEAFKDARALLD